MQQLALPLSLPDHATFANFYAGANGPLLAYLQQFIAGQHDTYCYLWGQSGAGCTHVLQACCQAALAGGSAAIYLPLAAVVNGDNAILQSLANIELVCLDDVQVIAGQAVWEEALFHLYNRLHATSHRLLLAGHAVPNQLGLQSPDLISRLNSALVAQIQPLSDAEKISALQLRAHGRGFELPLEVAQFLLTRFPRNFSILFNALQRMDQASLAAQRKLTIPFVKQVLAL